MNSFDEGGKEDRDFFFALFAHHPPLFREYEVDTNCGTYERGRGSFEVSAAEEVKRQSGICRINAWSYRVDMVGTAVEVCRGFLMG